MKKFLIIGLGSIGQRHMQNLANAFPGADFTVLRHRAASHPLIEEYGAKVVTRLSDALADTYDLVVVASPSANHIDVLPDLIRQGANLLVEKPIVTDLGHCDVIEDLLATAPPAQRVSGFNFRYMPSLQRVREIIASGELGTIVRASLTAGLWLPDWRPTQDYTQGYSADARRGGGVEMDLVHEIDLARWFFGDLKLAFACGGQLSSLDVKANDTSTFILTGEPAPLVQVSLDFVSRTRLRHYEIVGDKGGLVWSLDGRLEHLTPQGRVLLTDQPADFDVRQTYISMVDAIQNATPHLQSLEDGLKSSRLAIQARDFAAPDDLKKETS